MRIFFLTLFSILCGTLSSLIGYPIISAMFDRNLDKRMVELSSYSWGYTTSYLSLIIWIRYLKSKFSIRDTFFLSFFYNAFCFGFGVLLGGMVRKHKMNLLDS